MPQLSYRESELMAEHPYVGKHVAAGHRLHGGFDQSGRYCSPRTLLRWPAVLAWQKALQKRGWPLIDTSTRLLQRSTFPNFEQQKWLLQHGLGQTRLTRRFMSPIYKPLSPSCVAFDSSPPMVA